MIIRANAFLLHRKPYRNNSYILDCFTEEYGVLSTILRGAKNPKYYPPIELFHPYWIEYKKRPGLSILYKLESQHCSTRLSGEALYCGFYLNELIIKLLVDDIASPEIFILYRCALEDLSSGKPVEPILRHFEMLLLAYLGYALPLEYEYESGEVLKENVQYMYDVEKGFCRFDNMTIAQSSPHCLFHGNVLSQIRECAWDKPQVLADAKRLNRIALNHLLGDKPILSRNFFKKKKVYE